MKRLVAMAMIKLCGEAILFAMLAGIIIGILGYLNKWGTSLEYSNALFIAGCLMLIGGMASRLGAGQQWEPFQRLYAFRSMSANERASFVDSVSSSVGLVIIGVLSGILLILISVLVLKLF